MFAHTIFNLMHHKMGSVNLLTKYTNAVDSIPKPNGITEQTLLSCNRIHRALIKTT